MLLLLFLFIFLIPDRGQVIVHEIRTAPPRDIVATSDGRAPPALRDVLDRVLVRARARARECAVCASVRECVCVCVCVRRPRAAGPP